MRSWDESASLSTGSQNRSQTDTQSTNEMSAVLANTGQGGVTSVYVLGMNDFVTEPVTVLNLSSNLAGDYFQNKHLPNFEEYVSGHGKLKAIYDKKSFVSVDHAFELMYEPQTKRDPEETETETYYSDLDDSESQREGSRPISENSGPDSESSEDDSDDAKYDELCSYRYPPCPICKRISLDVNLAEHKRLHAKNAAHFFYFPKDYFCERLSKLDKTTQLSLLADSVAIFGFQLDILNAQSECAKNVVMILGAQFCVISHISQNLILKIYSEGIEKILDLLQHLIVEYQLYFKKYVQHTEYFCWKSLTTCIKVYFHNLITWNYRQRFFCGRTARFAALKNFAELLPKKKEVEKCGVCLSVDLDESCDFGILSGCQHVFCSSCLQRWTNKRFSCPVCRRKSSAWMSKSHFQKLNDGNLLTHT